MVRSAAIRARAGPRATTATRRAGDTLLVMDRMCTTRPSRSRAATGTVGPSNAKSWPQSSSTRNAPCAATTSSWTSPGRLRHVSPDGLAMCGWA